jgi:NADH:ubiquinone oxidoreductase subunit 3 (subunit A)
MTAPSSATVTTKPNSLHDLVSTSIQTDVEVTVTTETNSNIIDTTTDECAEVTRREIDCLQQIHHRFTVVQLVFIVIASTVAFLTLIAIVRGIVLCVNWKGLWHMRPKRTSKGVS